MKLYNKFLLILILSGNVFADQININSIDEQVIQKHKQDIKSEIQRNKLIRFVVGAGIISGIGYKLHSWTKYANEIKARNERIDKNLASYTEKYEGMSEIFKAWKDGKLGVIQNNTPFWSWQTVKDWSYTGCNTFVTQLLPQTLALAVQVAPMLINSGVPWFLQKYDINWMHEKTNFTKIKDSLNYLKNTPINLVLDPKILESICEKLTQDGQVNNSNMPVPTKDQLDEMKRNLEKLGSDESIIKFVQNIELLSNKLVNAVAQIIGFLNYQLDELKEAEKIKQMKTGIVELKSLINNYCQDVKLILEAVQSKKQPAKNFVDVMTNFESSYEHIISMIYLA